MKMLLSGLFLQLILPLVLWIPFGSALSTDVFYKTDMNKEVLVNGVDKFKYVKLNTPIYLYSNSYDHLYINENGLLTFDAEFPNFVNVPFPLEYSAIAPFYSNIDTTNANDSTSISVAISEDVDSIDDANDLIYEQFDNDYFRAKSIVIATWNNVGRYSEKNDLQNTFQAAIICGEDQTYVQFLYPENGLNWLQSDIGDSGLPDVRAQAGFISEDGQTFSLKGSGTDSVKYLSDLSNTGEPGSWLFHVGSRQSNDVGIKEPHNSHNQLSLAQDPHTCNNGGRLKCHTAAKCEDSSSSYCCLCKEGYYGNGLSCIKNDVPLRVSGKVTGNVNNIEISGQLQSYVVLSDGRSYTAISPLTSEVGYKTQLAVAFGNAIGWLFAKPGGSDPAPNGYQITGGKLNHTSTLTFFNSTERLQIVQRFRNLNAWDQLDVDVEISGSLPDIHPGATVTIQDTDIQYARNGRGSILSYTEQRALINDLETIVGVDQQITFHETDCTFEKIRNQPDVTFNKISKITTTFQERESALRIGMINKVLRDIQTNACTDGTANCGPNSVCVSLDEPEEYECQCENGFYENEGADGCVDVDECSGNHICHQYAECVNEPGGYSCKCRAGFIGNGHSCEVAEEQPSTELPVSSTTPNIPSLAPEHWLCDQCSEYADCFQGICQCRDGWQGDGFRCAAACVEGYVLESQQCVPVAAEDELEVTPFCHKDGCSCPTGYQLHEDLGRQSCNLIEDARTPPPEQLPCDAENNCSPNANCEWVEIELRNRCVCNPGFEGNGYECNEHEVSCLDENICDIHASCLYDDAYGRSVCKCDPKYVGDGRTCEPAPECNSREDCRENSVCENGICVCQEGFEKDISDFCIEAGTCGGALCAQNAICQWDNVEKVNYCLCPEGFEGNGVTSCVAVIPPCNIRNNCGRNAVCTPNYREPSIYECVCEVGFQGDGFKCDPEANCVNIPSLCHPNAQCHRTSSGFQCVCNAGFIGNGSICSEPPRHESGFLLLSQGIAVVRVPLDGRGGRPVAMSSMVIGLDKDCSQGRVYWSDISSKKIFSAKYDGTDKQTFIKDDIISPEGIAVDWISRHLYWTDSTKDTIEVASLDDPTRRGTVIRKHLVNPRGIAVDPHQNKLYWSDWNRESPKIEWSNLDGTEREILLSAPAVNLPNSLDISQKTGELCFADAGNHKIECIDTYSRSLRTIAANVSYPFGLAVTDDTIYWTDWTTKKIESTDHNGNRLPSISSPLFGSHKMYGVTAITDACPLFHSPCLINNGDCPLETICLVNSRAVSGRSCLGSQGSTADVEDY